MDENGKSRCTSTKHIYSVYFEKDAQVNSLVLEQLDSNMKHNNDNFFPYMT